MDEHIAIRDGDEQVLQLLTGADRQKLPWARSDEVGFDAFIAMQMLQWNLASSFRLMVEEKYALMEDGYRPLKVEGLMDKLKEEIAGKEWETKVITLLGLRCLSLVAYCERV